MKTSGAVRFLVILTLVAVETGFLSLALQPCIAQDVPGGQKPLSDEGRYGELDEYLKQASELYDAGKPSEAIEAAEKALAIERELYGPAFETLASTYELMARCHESRDEYTEARVGRERVAWMWAGLHGPDHWKTIDARWALETTKRMAALDPPQRTLLREATKTLQQAERYKEAANWKAALPPEMQVAEVYRQLLGEDNPLYGDSLVNLGDLHLAMDNHRQALSSYLQGLGVLEKSLGNNHPAKAGVLTSIGDLYLEIGDFAKASAMWTQACSLLQQDFWREPEYADVCCKLGTLYETCFADHIYGALFFVEAAMTLEEYLKEPRGATDVDRMRMLANLYQLRGDKDGAERMYKRVTDVVRESEGPKSLSYAHSLVSLAALCASTPRDYLRAKELARQAEQILKSQPPDVMSRLEHVYSIFLLALVIQQTAIDNDDYTRAEQLHRRVLQILKEHQLDRTLSYAMASMSLALLYAVRKDETQAAQLAGQAMQIFRDVVEQASGIQSERQQLQMHGDFRHLLGSYCVVTEACKVSPEEVFRHVLLWKGAVFGRQYLTRLAWSRPDLAPQVAELRSTTSQLAALRLDVATKSVDIQTRRPLIEKLEIKRDDLDRKLMSQSAEYRKQKAISLRTPAEVQKALPAGSALIDFIEYSVLPPLARNPELRLAAFVLRAGRPIERVNLGDAIAIAKWVDQWRKTYGEGGPGVAAAAELRRLVWDPLEQHLEGARLVLVSPDGALTRMPLGALPARKPGTYLIEDEELRLAVIPVPRLLPELLESLDAEGAPARRGLLLVGDVNYDVTPAKSVTPPLASKAIESLKASSAAPGKWRGGRMFFGPLEKTGKEICAIEGYFRRRYPNDQVRVLRKDEATEAEFRDEAPKHRWVHLATHGFFDPETLRKGFQDASGDSHFLNAMVHPGLLSGVALAGANRKLKGKVAPGQDDGILTALEVAELDLSGTDLVVLSACETGLGERVGGEGVLGLQRAFQIAGARTVVASLWKVQDHTTRAVMGRFYENLWQKGMPKLEALREAQLWMLREGRAHGLVPTSDTDSKPSTNSNGQSHRAPPRYWAAWSLSGAWD
jgi:CHAT domain-containing protein/tetratricopeptide (TPR) repeat protein